MKAILFTSCLLVSFQVIAESLYECVWKYQDASVVKTALFKVETGDAGFKATVREEYDWKQDQTEMEITERIYHFEECRQDDHNKNLIYCSNTLPDDSHPIKLQTRVISQQWLEGAGNMVRDELHASIQIPPKAPQTRNQEVTVRPFNLPSCQ